MMKNLSIILLCFAVIGCVRVDKDNAMVTLQAYTAEQIGLASSEELTVSNVVVGPENLLGTQDVTYTAKTKSGRTFDCKSAFHPATLITSMQIDKSICTVKKSHAN